MRWRCVCVVWWLQNITNTEDIRIFILFSTFISMKFPVAHMEKVFLIFFFRASINDLIFYI
ncbi:hypothetical protein HanRHA438_Chr11g0485601 [Helianthus annuus]|nr:hypothetical protein HanRHA438_Chr11g0485601 [Helianthus annuus]